MKLNTISKWMRGRKISKALIRNNLTVILISFFLTFFFGTFATYINVSRQASRRGYEGDVTLQNYKNVRDSNAQNHVLSRHHVAREGSVTIYVRYGQHEQFYNDIELLIEQLLIEEPHSVNIIGTRSWRGEILSRVAKLETVPAMSVFGSRLPAIPMTTTNTRGEVIWDMDAINELLVIRKELLQKSKELGQP